VKIYWNEGGK